MVSQPPFAVSSTGRASTAREAAVAWLAGRINYERTLEIPYNERQLKLDRIRTLLTRLGQPDAGLKIVHVAGTKGKGSTSVMIASILTAAGFRTGVFSSPHLDRIEERFAIDGLPCSADELAALVDRLRPVVDAMDKEAAAEGEPHGGPTYFEVTTALALVHFVERQVDAAVLEVGLGGRLDATNVCLPLVSVITSISFDHTQLLGNTLAAIAGEKAGIVKPGVPVVSGVTAPEAQAVVARTAREHGCRLIQLDRDFGYHYESRHVDFEYQVAGQELQLQGLALAMRGPHQAANAAVALATVAELRHQGWCISTDAMRAGLATASLSGRVEFFPGQPAVVLDTAHNAASAQALVAALAEIAPAKRRTLIMSVSRDKDVRAIVGELAPHFERIVVTQYQENLRAVPAQELAQLVRDANGEAIVTVCEKPSQAWEAAQKQTEPDELVCIAGSFFLAAEVRPLVLARQDAAAI